MSDQWRVSLYMIMSQNVMFHLGEGDFIMLFKLLDDWQTDPMSAIDGHIKEPYEISMA